MKAFLVLVISFFFAASSFANDFAASVGLRSNNADSATEGRTISSKTGISLGAVGFMDLAPSTQFRTGFFYAQKDVKRKSGSAEHDLNSSYIDIPLTFVYQIVEYGGVFGGPMVSLLASKDCKVPGCTEDPETTTLGFQIGTTFKFSPQFGAELYYESIPSEYWKGFLEDSRSVGANLLITL